MTNLYCQITLFNEYLYIEQVQDEIDEIDRIIRMLEDEILALAIMTEPMKMIKPAIEYKGSEYNEVDMTEIIRSKVYGKLEQLSGYYNDRFKLELLLDNWDKCHDINGKFIGLPENIHWDDAFIEHA